MIYGDGFVKGEEQGAVGYLIGEENRGLACMFTMMNNARLLVGIQGVGVAEAAYQQALAYAKERKQGRALGADPKQGMSPIIEHPDVQRMLLTMKALTQVARSITYACAHAIDMSHVTDGADAQFWSDRAGLLTPLAKSFATDAGVDVSSLGIQIHGGMGFIEETGAAQLLRDARITPIYEGTNGIQAIDLVMRKLPLQKGDHIKGFLAELQAMPIRQPLPTVRSWVKPAHAFPRPSARRAKRLTGCKKQRQKGAPKKHFPVPHPISASCRSPLAALILRVRHLPATMRHGPRFAVSLPKTCWPKFLR